VTAIWVLVFIALAFAATSRRFWQGIGVLFAVALVIGIVGIGLVVIVDRNRRHDAATAATGTEARSAPVIRPAQTGHDAASDDDTPAPFNRAGAIPHAAPPSDSRELVIMAARSASALPTPTDDPPWVETNPDRLVLTTRDSEVYHRPDCALVAGKQTTRWRRSKLGDFGHPCPVCRPGE